MKAQVGEEVLRGRNLLRTGLKVSLLPAVASLGMYSAGSKLPLLVQEMPIASVLHARGSGG